MSLTGRIAYVKAMKNVRMVVVLAQESKQQEFVRVKCRGQRGRKMHLE
jgi:hypothetical protein